MGKVLSLPSTLERGAHNYGPAFCSQCQHEWTSVAPIGTVFLECPNCRTWKGLMKGPVEPEHEQWTCNCGCHVFVISNTSAILCINCGAAHGQQFFPEDL